MLLVCALVVIVIVFWVLKQNPFETVYYIVLVTKNGKCYHRPGCEWIANSVTEEVTIERPHGTFLYEGSGSHPREINGRVYTRCNTCRP